MKINNFESGKITQNKKNKNNKKKEEINSSLKDKVTLGTGRPEKEVTYLYYMDGSNNLESYTLQNLLDMEKAGSTENMHIAVQLSRYQVPPLTKYFFGESIKKVVKDEKFAKQLAKELGDPEGVKEFQDMFNDPWEAAQMGEKILNKSLPLMQGVTQLISEYAGDMAEDEDMSEIMASGAKELAKEALKDDEEEFSGVAMGMSGANKMNSLAKHMKNAIKLFINDSMSGGKKLYLSSPPTGRVLKSADMVEGEGAENVKEPDWIGCRRYYVTDDINPDKIDSELIADVGLPNMGKPETLTDFIVWGMKNFPAKKYIIDIGDHGAGFLGACEDRDEFMSLPDLNKAFSDAEKQTGVKPDVIVFDACLMAQAEVAYELKDRADVMIASEETVGGAGLPYV